MKSIHYNTKTTREALRKTIDTLDQGLKSEVNEREVAERGMRVAESMHKNEKTRADELSLKLKAERKRSNELYDEFTRSQGLLKFSNLMCFIFGSIALVAIIYAGVNVR